jgi:hypothetical protein
MTGDQVKELVRLTAGNYPNTQGKDLTETSKLWKEVFANIPYELFKKSLLRTFDKAKFWPSVADIKEAIDLVSEERDRETFTARVKARNCPNCGGLVQYLSYRTGRNAGVSACVRRVRQNTRAYLRHRWCNIPLKVTANWRHQARKWRRLTFEKMDTRRNNIHAQAPRTDN